MNLITRATNILLAACGLAGCSSHPEIHISVKNSIDLARENEIIEIPMRALTPLSLQPSEQLVVIDQNNQQVAYQLTYDSLLIFPVSVAANGESHYTICTGKPEKVPVFTCGKQYPERLDDLAWENDKAAYRAYGPALEEKGERSFGYDIFTKSVAEPVVEERYRMHLDSQNPLSYHVDHGNGMDVYSVGATLGGGTAALMPDSAILYPYAYRKHEILDNGPLRFTVRLTFAPFAIGKDTAVTETRLISLDQGSHLNRTEVSYQGLSETTPIAAGIVIHPQNPDGYSFDRESRYMAYADSTDCTTCGNGVIYVGTVFTSDPENITLQWFAEEEKKKHSGALGHLLGGGIYHPGNCYTYYWGSGWSKAGISSMEAWETYLKNYDRRLKAPLQITFN